MHSVILSTSYCNSSKQYARKSVWSTWPKIQILSSISSPFTVNLLHLLCLVSFYHISFSVVFFNCTFFLLFHFALVFCFWTSLSEYLLLVQSQKYLLLLMIIKLYLLSHSFLSLCSTSDLILIFFRCGWGHYL